MSPRSLISGRVRFPVAPAKSELIKSASQDKATRGRKGQLLFANFIAEKTGTRDLAFGDVRSARGDIFAQQVCGDVCAILAAVVIGAFSGLNIAKALV